MHSICVYCGSSDKVPEVYLEAARQVGAEIAKRGLQLIYGAGGTGLMGALADAAMAGGGEVLGITPKAFNTPQLVHPSLTKIEVFDGMHQRKARMAELADAFVALPGGFGTLEELFEILTWAQIGLHAKPVGLLNTNGYFDRLLAFLDHVRAEGFIYAEHRGLYSHADTPASLLDILAAYQPPEGLERWVQRTE
jgi:uncharacterized protein (TIGR00730 family)